jgi:hypothetical protein
MKNLPDYHANLGKEIFTDHEERDIGTKLSVWQIGSILHSIMVDQGHGNDERGVEEIHLEYPNDPDSDLVYYLEMINATTETIPSMPAVFKTFGIQLWGTNYSQHLIE